MHINSILNGTSDSIATQNGISTNGDNNSDSNAVDERPNNYNDVKWGCFDTIEQLEQLIKFCDSRCPSEKDLRKELYVVKALFENEIAKQHKKLLQQAVEPVRRSTRSSAVRATSSKSNSPSFLTYVNSYSV